MLPSVNFGIRTTRSPRYRNRGASAPSVPQLEAQQPATSLIPSEGEFRRIEAHEDRVRRSDNFYNSVKSNNAATRAKTDTFSLARNAGADETTARSQSNVAGNAARGAIVNPQPPAQVLITTSGKTLGMLPGAASGAVGANTAAAGAAGTGGTTMLPGAATTSTLDPKTQLAASKAEAAQHEQRVKDAQENFRVWSNHKDGNGKPIYPDQIAASAAAVEQATKDRDAFLANGAGAAQAPAAAKPTTRPTPVLSEQEKGQGWQLNAHGEKFHSLYNHGDPSQAKPSEWANKNEIMLPSADVRKSAAAGWDNAVLKDESPAAPTAPSATRIMPGGVGGKSGIYDVGGQRVMVDANGQRVGGDLAAGTGDGYAAAQKDVNAAQQRVATATAKVQMHQQSLDALNRGDIDGYNKLNPADPILSNDQWMAKPENQAQVAAARSGPLGENYQPSPQSATAGPKILPSAGDPSQSGVTYDYPVTGGRIMRTNTGGAGTAAPPAVPPPAQAAPAQPAPAPVATAGVKMQTRSGRIVFKQADGSFLDEQGRPITQ